MEEEGGIMERGRVLSKVRGEEEGKRLDNQEEGMGKQGEGRRRAREGARRKNNARVGEG
jgi:hypothetical protein